MHDRQAAILRYILAFKREHAIAPTLREIAAGCGIPLTSAYHHVDMLAKANIISFMVDSNSQRLYRSLRVRGEKYELPTFEQLTA